MENPFYLNFYKTVFTAWFFKNNRQFSWQIKIREKILVKISEKLKFELQKLPNT